MGTKLVARGGNARVNISLKKVLNEDNSIQNWWATNNTLSIDVDLCKAKNKQLFFSVNAAGEPPFQGTIMGVPPEMTAIILVVIDQNFPFEVSIGILDTTAWEVSATASNF